jgi:hypothetical protein
LPELAGIFLRHSQPVVADAPFCKNPKGLHYGGLPMGNDKESQCLRKRNVRRKLAS